MASLSIRVGLVDTTGLVDSNTLAAVAAALNVQVTRDLPQYWDVRATVAFLPNADQIPMGIWPVQLVKELDPGEGGFHLTQNNQPYAKVLATPNSLDWTIDASHETLEMLCDSAGNRLQVSEAIRVSGNDVIDDPDGGQYEYLVEVCDPCEANELGYQVDGYLMSDFITPHFYELQHTPGTRYSFTGAVTRPRQILKGGYISYINESTSAVEQILWVEPGPPQHKVLGSATGASLRAFVETKTREHVHSHRQERMTGFQGYRDRLASAAKARAKHYR